jgi:hypothetical protein
MTKMSKDKRDKLVLTCLAFIGAAGILYTFVLGAQKDQLAVINRQILSTRDKLSKAERLVRNARTIESNLQESQKALEARQDDMAPQGQYYYWFLKLMDQFRKDEKLETDFIVGITQPEFIEAGLLPNFPYKAASFSVRLSGQFHEVGRFIADLENKYPYFRVQNPKLSPQRLGSSGLAQSRLAASTENNEEKLVVELRVVTLIRPGMI